MAESNDLQAALDEYGSSASPYSALDQYLMQQPVYDRGPREAPAAPTLRTLEAITPDSEDMLASQYERIMEEQRASDEAATAARQTEIDSLRDLLRQELATSEEAALGQRSELTKTLEDQIESMRRGVDAENLDLRQAGLDERAALAQQIEEGDRLVRQAQETAAGSLQDRIATLSGDLSDITGTIDANYAQLDEVQKNAADATQGEIDSLNQQLESLYTDVESGNAAQSEAIQSETADLIAGLEQQIGGLADNLGALPLESIQSQLAAVNDQTAQFQQAVDSATTERADLASRIDALQSSGLTQDDLSGLSQTIAGQRQSEISSALDPVQQQIEALRGQIPGEVDTEALRKQITDDVMAQMASQQPPATTTPPITVGSAEGQQGVVTEPDPYDFPEPEMGAYSSATYGIGPSASEAAGFNPYGGAGSDARDYTQYDPGDYARGTVPKPNPMVQNQMTGRVGDFIPDMRDIMQGINVRGMGV